MVTKKTRRVDDNNMRKIGQWIQRESWEEVYNGNTASGMADKFVKTVHDKLDEICPEEELRITKMDGKQTSLALQKLARQKLRKYTRHGNSAHFKDLKRKQKERRRVEGQKKLDKAIEEAVNKGSGWMRKAQALSSIPGEEVSSTFSLPNHIEQNLSAKQSAEKLVKYFSSISQEFTPLQEDTLPDKVEQRLSSDPGEHPNILEHEVYKNMKESKKTDTVPGDVPAAILKEFLP